MTTVPAERPYLALALLRNLRVARSVIVLVILLGLVLPHVVADLSLYHPLWTGPAWFLGLLGIAVADAVLVVRHRTWGSARWPVAAFVLALSVWATALLPPSALVGPPHQTLGPSAGSASCCSPTPASSRCSASWGCTSRSPWCSSGSRTASTCSPVDLVVVVAATGGSSRPSALAERRWTGWPTPRPRPRTARPPP